MTGERSLPGVGLKGFWTPSSNGWNTEMDLNLLKASVLLQANAASRVTAIAAQADGTVLIVPTGAPSHANEIAAKDNGAWFYITPVVGCIVFVADEDIHVMWTGGSWVPLISGGTSGNSTLGIVTYATANRDTILTDAGKVVRYNSATAGTYTIQPDATVDHADGTVIHFRQVGDGKLSFVAGSGVTILSAETLNLRKKGSGATIHKVADNTWEIVGDMELTV